MVRAGLKQQVDVIVHEYIGVEGAAVADAIAFQPLQIRRRIGVVVDDHRTAVAPDPRPGPTGISCDFAHLMKSATIRK